MNIAICDDEKAIREQINELVVKEKPGVCPELYETGDGLLATGKQFDIVFLDIWYNADSFAIQSLLPWCRILTLKLGGCK